MTARDQPIGDDDLQALIDDRLTAERRAAVEAYLAAHPAVAADVANDIEIARALRARLTAKAQEPIPSRLRVANIMADRRRARMGRLGSIAAALALLMMGAGAGWIANSTLQSRGLRMATAPTRDAFAAYRTFVVERLHPVEVAADQQEHLVQWLSRRLGRPLAAPNLAAQGYELMGGRLLPTGGGPAAMFMYANKANSRLTLYVRADSADALAGFQFERQGEISAFSWIDRDLAYVVTANAERPELLGVAEAVYKQLAPAGAEKL